MVGFVGILDKDPAIVCDAGEQDHVLAVGELALFVYQQDHDLAVLKGGAHLAPFPGADLKGQAQHVNGVVDPLDVVHGKLPELLCQLLRGDFLIQQIAGGHGQAGDAAAAGGDGSVTVGRVGVVRLVVLWRFREGLQPTEPLCLQGGEVPPGWGGNKFCCRSTYRQKQDQEQRRRNEPLTH